MRLALELVSKPATIVCHGRCPCFPGHTGTQQACAAALKLAVVSWICLVLCAQGLGQDTLGPDIDLTDSAVVDFSPDGTTLAVLGAYGDVTVWDLRANRPTTVFRKDVKRTAMALSLDGKALITALGKEVIVSDLAGTTVRTLAHADAVTTVAAATSRPVLAAVTGNTITLWNAAKGIKVHELDAGAPVSCVALAPDGKVLVSASEGTLMFWDTSTGKRTYKRAFIEGAVSAIAFAPDGAAFAVISSLQNWNRIQFVDVASATLKEPTKLSAGNGKLGAPHGFAFSSTKLAALARQPRAEPAELVLWDIQNDREVARRELGKGMVRSLAFSPNGELLAVAGDEGLLWELESAVRPSGPLAVFQQGWEVYDVAFSPDSKLLAISSRAVQNWRGQPTSFRSSDEPRPATPSEELNRTEVKIWNVDRPATQKAQALKLSPYRDRLGTSGTSPILELAWSGDGLILAGAGGVRGHSVHTWTMPSGKENPPWVAHPDNARGIFDVAFSADSKWLLATGEDGQHNTQIFLFERGKRTEPSKVRLIHGFGVVAVAPDNTLLAYGNAIYTFPAGVYQNSIAKDLPIMPNPPTASAVATACSTDKTKLAFAGWSQREVQVHSFDIATGEQQQSFSFVSEPETKHSRSLYVGMNDKFVAAGVTAEQGTRMVVAFNVWDAATGELQAAATAEGLREVRSVELSPDGNFLAIGGFANEDEASTVGRVLLWKLSDVPLPDWAK